MSVTSLIFIAQHSYNIDEPKNYKNTITPP